MAFNHTKFTKAIAGEALSRGELAKALGVHYNTIGNWANGGAVPTPFQLYRVLKAVGMEFDELKEQRLIDWYMPGQPFQKVNETKEQ